jgi:hypothetical protein
MCDLKSAIFAVYSSSTCLINLLISDVSILSLYSSSGISKIFFICSRNSLDFSSCCAVWSHHSVFPPFVLLVFSSDFVSFLFQSSVQKTLSSIESIQLFLGLAADSFSSHKFSDFAIS